MEAICGVWQLRDSTDIESWSLIPKVKLGSGFVDPPVESTFATKVKCFLDLGMQFHEIAAEDVAKVAKLISAP